MKADDERVTAMLLELGSAGNLMMTTLRAYEHEIEGWLGEGQDVAAPAFTLALIHRAAG